MLSTRSPRGDRRPTRARGCTASLPIVAHPPRNVPDCDRYVGRTGYVDALPKRDLIYEICIYQINVQPMSAV